MIYMYMLIMQRRYICNIWITIKENIHLFYAKLELLWIKDIYILYLQNLNYNEQEYILYMQILNYMYDDERYGHVKYAKL